MFLGVPATHTGKQKEVPAHKDLPTNVKLEEETNDCLQAISCSLTDYHKVIQWVRLQV